MNLLQTLILYFSLLFMSSVEYAPQASVTPYIPTPVPTAIQAEVTPAPTRAVKTPTIIISMTPNPAYKTIKSGDSGDQVRELQEKLHYYGYYEGSIDGRYGNQTRHAVERFQFVHGLSADGIAGKQTLTVLYESPDVVFADRTEASNPKTTPNIQKIETVRTATPAPTAALASEPTQTPEPTPYPTPIFIPIETPAATGFNPITAEQMLSFSSLKPMEGYTLTADGGISATQNSELFDEILLYRNGDTVYYPLKELLHALGMNVIRNETMELQEMAFADSKHIVQIASEVGADDRPESITVRIDRTMPLLSPDALVYGNDQLYVSDELLSTMLSVRTEVNDTDQTVLLKKAAE